MRIVKIPNGPIMLIPKDFNKKSSMDELFLFVSNNYKYLEQVGTMYYKNIKEYRI